MSRMKFKTEGEAIDIPGMTEMRLEEYEKYIRGTLLFVDHHDVLRASFGEYPIATSKEQIRVLIGYLLEIAQRMEEAE